MKLKEIRNDDNIKQVPSLIKWTGSKRSQARKISKFFPEFKRYFEPFLGGGSVMYYASERRADGCIASDLYAPLIDLWVLIKKNPKIVIDNYSEQWKNLSAELDSLYENKVSKKGVLPEYFYLVRDRFNKLQDPLDLNFIMRTCVNGIVRFNRLGEFNNSFHLSRKGMTPDNFSSIINQWSSRIQNVDFLSCDYEESISRAKKGDFVYLDPPYARSKNRYIDDLDINRFFDALTKLNSRGVNWALSFDGSRGSKDLSYEVPKDLYKSKIMILSGKSAVNKVLNGPVEDVHESLYLNYSKD